MNRRQGFTLIELILVLVLVVLVLVLVLVIITRAGLMTRSNGRSMALIAESA